MSNYLNDESNNDYQLINEISELLKIYKKNNKRVDRNFVDRVMNIALINDSLNINSKILFDSGNFCGYYGVVDKGLYLNYQHLQSSKKYYKNARLKDGNLFEYYEFIISILHEMTHAKQYDIIDSNVQCEASNLYKYSDEFLKNNLDLYISNHDTVPYERYANIRSNYLAVEILKRIYNLEELWFFQWELLYYLLYNYDNKGLYPLRKFNELVENYSLPRFDHLIPKIDISDDNLYERLNIGLPITKEEYNYLIEIRSNYLCSKEKSKNSNFDLTTELVKNRIKK